MSSTDWIALLLGIAAFGGTIWSNLTAQKAVKLAGKQRVADLKKAWIEDVRKDIADYLSLDTQLNLFAINRATYSQMKFDKKSPTEIVERMKKVVENESILTTESVLQKTTKFEMLNLKLNSQEVIQKDLLDSLGKLMIEVVQNDSKKSAAIHHEIVFKAHSLLESEWNQVLAH